MNRNHLICFNISEMSERKVIRKSWCSHLENGDNVTQNHPGSRHSKIRSWCFFCSSPSILAKGQSQSFLWLPWQWGEGQTSHLWYGQLAAKLREYTAGEYKGLCKLHFGVPILKTDFDFCALYDRVFEPLDYPTKLEIMSTPGMFNVTSLMKVEPMSLYLEQIQMHFADRVHLAFSEDALWKR